ncbi:hypothetical protein AVEN_162943-1 [Araneus ventricosus]|uniref:Uncharacterized protein n=1 Tax=Araneus ventricosus TaxID=182803 RepID=A0A4Y2BZ16_ARAVE|nr:hypothetical protein AVEN_162943-1 [Araneus ventricosus]
MQLPVGTVLRSLSTYFHLPITYRCFSRMLQPSHKPSSHWNRIPLLCKVEPRSRKMEGLVHTFEVLEFPKRGRKPVTTLTGSLWGSESVNCRFLNSKLFFPFPLEMESPVSPVQHSTLPPLQPIIP